MEQLKAQIKKSKPTISDGSLKIYSGNIFRLYKNIVKSDDAKFKTDFLKNFEAVKNFIYTKKSLQTKKQYFATVVVVAQALKLSPAIINKYRAEMIKVKEEQEETTESQKKTPKQEANWITYEQLYNTYKHYKKLITINKIRSKSTLDAKEYRLVMDFICLSLFLASPRDNPPRRASDYANMNIIKKLPDDKSNNYLLIKNSRNKTFIFNKYKTARNYGTQAFKAGRSLNNDLNLWLKYNKSKKYLLHDPKDPASPLGSNRLTKHLNIIFKKRFNKNISVNLIRSITLSNIYKDMKPLSSLEEIASKMSHSFNEAIKNYVKK